MKIAYFTNNYLPYVSGVGASIESFRLELEKRGHQVYVLAPSFKKMFGGTEGSVENSKIIRYFSLWTNFKTVFPVALLPAPKITKRIKQIEPDIFHAHHPFWLGNEALKHAKKLKKPLIFTAHTKFEHYVHYVPFFPSKILARFLIGKRARFANKCAAVIAPTEAIKRELVKEGVRRPIYVIHSGINLDNFRKASREKIRKKYGIASRERVFLFLGRLEKEKNLDLLIKIIPAILDKYAAARFLIVGDGFGKKMFNSLEERYPRRVICPGKVAYKEAIFYYKASDIFIQPSLSETQGLTTMEAMVAGSAVIAVNSKVIRGFIENGKNGLVVPATERGLLKASYRLLDDEKYLLNLQKKALEIKRIAGAGSCTEKLLAVYNKVILDSSAKKEKFLEARPKIYRG